MSKDIVSVLKDFKEMVELRKFAESQQVLINDLNNKMLSLQKENGDLKLIILETNKDKIISTGMTPGVIKIELTPEELIIAQQISRLQNSSEQRELTLEEVKKLDLYIKNYNLIKSQPTTIVGESRNINLPDQQLLDIANSEPETHE